MADDSTSRVARERRQYAFLATALLLVVSAYAAVLNLPGRDSLPSADARSSATIMAAVLFAVSFAGIAAAARPSGCSELLRPTKRAKALDRIQAHPSGSTSFRLVAHHCNCGRFADHVLRVGGRDWCAGCLGMAAGGIVGMGLSAALASGFLFVTGRGALAMVLAGAAASAAGLYGVYRGPGSPPLRTGANLSFVAGIVLLSALLASHGLLVGLLGLSVALGLVGLRMEMSRLRHRSIVQGCPWGDACRWASAASGAA